MLQATDKINLLYLLLPAGMAASYAFMLPVATPPNAIAFSYGRLRVVDMVSNRGHYFIQTPITLSKSVTRYLATRLGRTGKTLFWRHVLACIYTVVRNTEHFYILNNSVKHEPIFIARRCMRYSPMSIRLSIRLFVVNTRDEQKTFANWLARQVYAHIAGDGADAHGPAVWEAAFCTIEIKRGRIVHDAFLPVVFQPLKDFIFRLYAF